MKTLPVVMDSGLSPSAGQPQLNTTGCSNNTKCPWSVLLDVDSLHGNHSLILHQHFYNILLGVFLGLLSLVTVVMNLLVLYAVKKEKSLHTVGNLYIVSLSVADFIVGTTVMPLNLAYLLEDEWKLGRAVCQFWLIMDYVASTASIFSLFILCWDRYRSVRQPLKYMKYRTQGKASMMISGAWLLSMMWIIPILGWRSFTNVDLKPEKENKCDTDFRFVTWFKVITAVFNFYVPSVLMMWFYTHIYFAVRQHLRDRERIIHPTDSFLENGNVRNAQSPVKSDTEFPKKEREPPQKLPKKSLLAQNTLQQTYSLEDADTTKMASSRSHRKVGVECQQASFSVNKTKQLRLEEKVKSCSLSSEEKPQDVVRLEGNNGNKLQASLNECHLTVPNSVSGTCDVHQGVDVNKCASTLYSNKYNSSRTLPWVEKGVEDPNSGSANTATLRQTWQRFIGQSRHRFQSLRIHKEHKAAKQLGFIIAAFLLCWIPYFIVYMVMAFCRDCVHHDLHMFTIWLGYFNSTLNPFIYPLCNGNFKRVFKDFVKISL